MIAPSSPADRVKPLSEYTNAVGLSLDGGGARGIITIIALDHIQKQLGVPLNDVFSVWDGASVGGLIASFLNIDDGKGKPKWNTAQMLEIFNASASKIFSPKSTWDKVKTLDFTFGPKYTHKGLEEVSQQYAGDFLFRDCLCELNIPVVNVFKGSAGNFSSIEARQKNDPITLGQVVSAATDAETYWSLKKVTYLGNEFTGADGGTFRNNPTLHNFAVLNTRFPPQWPRYILSIGTGNVSCNLPPSIVHAGKEEWASPISNFMMDTQSSDVDQTAKLLLGDNVLRLNVQLESKYGRMDDFSPQTMAYRTDKANEMLEENADAIRDFCNKIDPKMPFV